MWLLMTLLSALFSSLVIFLIKSVVKRTDSDVVSAMVSFVVLVFSWIAAYIAGSQSTVTHLSNNEIIFLVLSGLSIGISWIFFYKSLAIATISKATPLYSLKVFFSIISSIVIFNVTENIVMNIVLSILLLCGVLIICKNDNFNSKKEYSTFLISVFLYAFFINLSVVLSEYGATNVENNLANSIKICVVLVYTWLIVFIKDKRQLVFNIRKVELIHIFIIGLFIVGSYFCFYNAIKYDYDNVVVLINRLSFLISILLATIFLKEKPTIRDIMGYFIITVAFILIAVYC